MRGFAQIKDRPTEGGPSNAKVPVKGLFLSLTSSHWKSSEPTCTSPTGHPLRFTSVNNPSVTVREPHKSSP